MKSRYDNKQGIQGIVTLTDDLLTKCAVAGSKKKSLKKKKTKK